MRGDGQEVHPDGTGEHFAGRVLHPNVERDSAGGAVESRVGKFHAAAQRCRAILHHGKFRRIRRAECVAQIVLHRAQHLQFVARRRERLEHQFSATRRFVVNHRADTDPLPRRRIGDSIVRWIEHGTRICRRAAEHRRVERHGDAIDLALHALAIARIAGNDRRRLGREEHVHTRRAGDVKPSVAPSGNECAARAARRQQRCVE